jgi:hypothetical protein
MRLKLYPERAPIRITRETAGTKAFFEFPNAAIPETERVRHLNF